MPLFGGPPNIQKLKANGNVRGLIAALAYSEDQNIQKAAAEALAEIGQMGPIDALVSALIHKDQRVRLWAVEALGKTQQTWVIPPLIEALKDSDLFVRARAADLLGESRSPTAVQPLIAALSDGKGDVRASAARALGKVGDQTAVGPLTRLAAQDPSDYARGTAASAVVSLGALDKENERVAQQLLVLLTEWHGAWQHHSAQQVFAGISSKIVDIGQSTCANGGIDRMLSVARRVKELALHRGLPADLANQVADLWRGIGEIKPGERGSDEIEGT